MTERDDGRRKAENPRARWYRAGPTVWSPSTVAAARTEDRHIEGEMEAIVAALREHGPLGARELRRLTEARFWGPGRFGTALARARREGRVRRTGPRRYAAV
jgi:hypothetical protein